LTATDTTTPSAPYWDEVIAPDRARFRAKIAGLHCSLCTGTLEKALGRQPGVDKVAVSLTHEQALVEYDPRRVRPQDLMDTLRDIGYRISDPRKLQPFEEEEAELVREGRRLLVASAFSLVALALTARASLWSLAVPTAVGGLLLAVAFLILKVRGTGLAVAVTGGFAGVLAALLALRAAGVAAGAVPWVTGALALVVVFGVASHFLAMAAQSLRRGILNQHVLLEFGAAAGITGGLIGLIARPDRYPTAAFFAVAVLIVNYHTFSEWLSLLVKTRSSQAVKRLLDLQPDTALLLRDGTEVEVDVTAVAVGDLVRIRPGARVPVDGEVVAGHSAVDQAFVTGEPILVEKSEGDEVIGGSINGSGTLLVRATAVGEASFLAQVVRQIEDARALKPGILHLVDRVLRVYTPFVLIAAAVAGLAWSLLAGDVERGVFAGLSVLVMGYPCAVGIAAPLAIVRGAGEAADEGILMRTGEAFQSFRLVRRVVLDKTGTLTEGRPTVVAVEALGSKEDLLAVAAAAEASSEHPLARAVLDAALAAGAPMLSVSDFDSHTGRGVAATLDGARVLVGRPRFLAEQGVDIAALERRVSDLEEAGHTVIAVSRDGRPLGLIALADRLRDDATQAVAEMRRAGLIPILVTGDNERAARRVAAEVGIDEVHAGVLPGEKAEIIRDLQQAGTKVAMVGDGINDAPALMQADVGVAMGAGTDIAIESADVIIVGNRLASVLRAREISRRSYRKTRQNVILAFVFNGIGIPAAATGLIYPVWAMAAMAGSVSAIFVNSLCGRLDLLVGAISSVGRPVPAAEEPTPVP
jgi:heavy metal translocating P-type ATPase